MVDEDGVLWFREDETGEQATNHHWDVRHWGDMSRLCRSDGALCQGCTLWVHRFVLRLTWRIDVGLRIVDSCFVSTEDTDSTASGLDDAFHSTNRSDVTVEEVGTNNHRCRQAGRDDERDPKVRVS